MGKQKNQSKLSKVKENVKSNLVESLELPMDIMYGAVIITAMGRNQILVERIIKALLNIPGRKSACRPRHARSPSRANA